MEADRGSPSGALIDTPVIFLPLTVIVACTAPYRSATEAPVMVRVVATVGWGVAVAAGFVGGVAGAPVGVGDADEPDEEETEALGAALPASMAWSMTRPAVAEGTATPAAVRADGKARPRNDRFMVWFAVS